MESKDGDYTRAVASELRVRCVHLLTKEAFLALPAEHEREFEADDPIWWCDKSGAALGPDGSEVCRAGCHGAARSCYEGPVRL